MSLRLSSQSTRVQCRLADSFNASSEFDGVTIRLIISLQASYMQSPHLCMTMLEMAFLHSRLSRLEYVSDLVSNLGLQGVFVGCMLDWTCEKSW